MDDLNDAGLMSADPDTCTGVLFASRGAEMDGVCWKEAWSGLVWSVLFIADGELFFVWVT